jgi:bifunctional DNase/RNase
MHSNCFVDGCQNEAIVLVISVDASGAVTELSACDIHATQLDIEYRPRDPRTITPESFGRAFDISTLYALLFFYQSAKYYVLLRKQDSSQVFVFETGYVEACSIYGALQAPTGGVSLRYELFDRIIQELGGSIIEASIDGYDADLSQYRSHVLLQGKDSVIKVACRGSDAIGIAYSGRKPIKVDSEFFREMPGSSRNK